MTTSDRVQIAETDYFGKPDRPESFVPSGCTMLDCVLGGGYPIGRIVNIVGDKSTGKTLLAIEALANFRRKFPKGRAVYNETEAAFDLDYADRLGIPMDSVDLVNDCFTVEDLFDDLNERVKAVKDDEPTLYIVDSLDALSDASEMESDFDAASYGAKKAQRISKFFRQINKILSQKKFLLVFVSQTRANIGVSFGEKHTRSGGRALDFYASQILWLAHRRKISRQISGVKMVTGVDVVANCKKNKISRPFRTCEFRIVFGYGIDDLSASINFLKEAKETGIVNNLLPRLDTEKDDAKRQEIVDQIHDAAVKKWYVIEQTALPAGRKYG